MTAPTSAKRPDGDPSGRSVARYAAKRQAANSAENGGGSATAKVFASRWRATEPRSTRGQPAQTVGEGVSNSLISIARAPSDSFSGG